MNVGVLGGTFDPVHIGHLIIAEEARLKLGLSKVLFVPAGQPWLKQDRNITAAVHRLEMVRVAIADNPYFELSTLEVERPGPSYAVDTLTIVRKQLGSRASLFFILGRDALAELPLWKEPRKVMRLCRFVVAPRPLLERVESSGSEDLKDLERAIPGLLERVIELDMPVIGISSSEVRQRMAQGLPVRYLVPPGVEGYIAEHRVYPVSANWPTVAGSSRAATTQVGGRWDD